MAAFGSLQHIFEHPLPESPTLLGRTLSSWKQIKPTLTKPTEQSSSVTEIFGELHFKENSDLPSSPTFPKISPFSSAIFKHTRDDEKVQSTSSSCSTTKVIHKKSFSLNSDSLQVCTEGLGFESSDSVEVMKQEWENSKEKIDKASKIIKNKKRKEMHGELRINRSRRSNSIGNIGEFPPPISCIGNCGKPWVCLKSYRQDGRFVLKQVRIPTQELLHACREDGRLKLFMQPNDKSMEQQESKEEEGFLINDVIDGGEEERQAS